MIHPRRSIAAIAILSLAFFVPAKLGFTQEKNPTPSDQLSVDRIFSTNEFAAKSISAQWIPQNKHFDAAYTTLENSEDVEGGKDIVRRDAATGDRTVMVSAADLVPAGKSKPLSIDGYQLSGDLSRVLIFTNAQKVWRNKTRGDYWVLDRGSRQITQLGGDGEPETMMFAKFSPDGRKVAFVRNQNLFIQDLFDWSIKAVSAVSSDNIINGTTDWVYEEEFGLRDGFRWSPDGKRIAFWQLDVSDVPEFTMINNTDSLYPKLQTFAYPKVGQRNPKARIGVYEIHRNSTRWLEIPPHTGDSVERGEYIPRMEWVEQTDELLVCQLNRLQNVERLYLFNFNSGVVQLIHTERDEAWIDMHDEIFWNEDASSFLWPSDRAGWRQVYRQSVDGSEAQLMTPDKADAIEILHADSKRFYFIASPDSATQRYLYRGISDAKPARRVTPRKQTGTHTYKISPTGDFAIHTWSTAAMPPVIDLVSLPDHKRIRVLEDNRELRKKLDQLAMPDIEFFKVDIGPTELDAWALLPPEFDKNNKYPLLVYVYGEPAGSTVINRWGGTKFLWHLMMAQKGYVVMSFDNRGTKAPRGREFRKSIYRKIGIQPPKDQAAAVRSVLKSRKYLDPKRVGIWGWSGGGSSSLQAIFKYPDLYQTAVAVAPVPNQLYYDTIYQERYMGLPSDNVEGFREGSAINFAKNLKGNLLLIHGTADDNVHYQGSEMLINELVARNKQFSMFSYPNRSHSVNEGENTTRHLRTLMTNYLLESLPPSP